MPQAVVDGGPIPAEMAGPFPGDGSNGPDALAEYGIVRSDITSSIAGASGVAAGVPLRVRLRVFDLSGEQPSVFPGAAVYVWHCDREGRHSMYDEGVESENYLRGVQAADDDGWLEFTTIFPGCYPGRWPHLHMEVFSSLSDARRGHNKWRTSQLALPAQACREAYENPGYDIARTNFRDISLVDDLIFADGHSLQMARVTGSADAGFEALLNVPV